MSHRGQENPETGLRDVFDILVKAPQERLLSLTFQLNESAEDNIIHALCLIVLQRGEQAMNKLQMLSDNYLAKHLAEKWQMSDGKLEDFGVHCDSFQEFTRESLAGLARIFKVLSEQNLCDPHLRNLAYERALSTDDQNTSNSEVCVYDQLREEAKVVCGPRFAEWMSSPTDLKSGSHSELHSSLDERSTTLKVTLSQDQSERAHDLPGPLKVSSSMSSYPTHLEISIPPTASFGDNQGTPETLAESKVNTPVLLDSLVTSTQITKPTANFALPTATNIVLPKMPVANESEGTEEEEDEEEAVFYAFVILHAPEDVDMAESMREKLETVTGRKGATFSEDFATPGKSTLRCVEDAINSTAFTLLLLTRNFNTRMQDLQTNSALINSVHQKHKYNTVIPLLPRENCMPRESIPLVLRTIVPLEENRSFERKIKKSLSPAEIKKQEKIWFTEKSVKKQIERQERLKRLQEHQKQLMTECERAQLLERENLQLLMRSKLLLNVAPGQDGGDNRVWWQQQPNININHAKYIMIGNDSQMTVDLGAGADKDDSDYREDEQ